MPCAGPSLQNLRTIVLTSITVEAFAFKNKQTTNWTECDLDACKLWPPRSPPDPRNLTAVFRCNTRSLPCGQPSDSLQTTEHRLPIYSSVSGHLRAEKNNAAKILPYRCLCARVFTSLGKCAGVELLGHMAGVWEPHTKLPNCGPKRLYYLKLHEQCGRLPACAALSLTLGTVGPFPLSSSSLYGVVFHCDFHLHFLMTNDI